MVREQQRVGKVGRRVLAWVTDGVIEDLDDGAGGGNTVTEDAAPTNVSNGHFDLRVPESDDGVTTGTFTLEVTANGETQTTAAITWDPDPEVTAQNALDAINALSNVDGAAGFD